jgi:hypothetical protein
MKFKEYVIAVLIVALGCAVGSGLVLVGERGTTPPAFGSASDNVLPLLPTATKVFVTGSDTTIIGTSTGRQYLEITNISSSSPFALFCNYGDRPAVLNSGFVIYASSSKVWNLDNLYRGAIHCIATASGAAAAVTDF